jgi:hypothetical protein
MHYGRAPKCSGPPSTAKRSPAAALCDLDVRSSADSLRPARADASRGCDPGDQAAHPRFPVRRRSEPVESAPRRLRRWPALLPTEPARYPPVLAAIGDVDDAGSVIQLTRCDRLAYELNVYIPTAGRRSWPNRYWRFHLSVRIAEKSSNANLLRGVEAQDERARPRKMPAVGQAGLLGRQHWQ